MSAALRIVPGRWLAPRPAPQRPVETVPRPTPVLVGPEGWPPPRAVQRRRTRVVSSYAMRAAPVLVTPPKQIVPAIFVGVVPESGTQISMTPANLLFGPEADISQFKVTLLDPGVY